MHGILKNVKYVIAIIIFAGLSLLIQDIRHPYFNSAAFSVALMVQFIVFHLLMGHNIKSFIALLAYSGMGYLASVIAFLLAWLWQGNSGVSLSISNFGAFDTMLDVLIFPVFSYAFLLFPAAAGLGWLMFETPAQR